MGNTQTHLSNTPEEQQQQPSAATTIVVPNATTTAPQLSGEVGTAATSGTPAPVLHTNGTYFGPHFLIDSSHPQIQPGQPLQATQAFWDEILNVLSGGPGAADTEMTGLGNIYNQLPSAELKHTTTLQAQMAIQKNTVLLVKTADTSHNLFTLEFVFDSIAPCNICLYWNARETYVTDEHGQTAIRFVGPKNTPVLPWTFGPFPAGLGQKFILPTEYALDPLAYIPGAVAAQSLPELLHSDSPISPVSPIGSSPFIPLLHTPTPSSGSTPSHSNPGLSMTRDGNSVVDIEGPSSYSGVSQGTSADRSTFVSNTTDGLFALCIHCEVASVNPRLAGSSIELEVSPSPSSQTMFTTFSMNQEEGCQAKVVKQLLMINGASYAVQEIYGFTDPDGTANPNDCKAEQHQVLPHERPHPNALYVDRVNLPEPFMSRDSVASRRRSKAVSKVSIELLQSRSRADVHGGDNDGSGNADTYMERDSRVGSDGTGPEQQSMQV
ncbi:hypothetical protein BSLG_000368 [Batrachochytrium salamandrivorans]|nr:hypothetical protein BSLG_000368 [Batrachochytrium salamandrivorans]